MSEVTLHTASKVDPPPSGYAEGVAVWLILNRPVYTKSSGFLPVRIKWPCLHSTVVWQNACTKSS